MDTLDIEIQHIFEQIKKLDNEVATLMEKVASKEDQINVLSAILNRLTSKLYRIKIIKDNITIETGWFTSRDKALLYLPKNTNSSVIEWVRSSSFNYHKTII